MRQVLSPGLLRGEVVIPPSKSDAQRALLLAALTPGTSTIYEIGLSDDVRTMLKCIKVLGAALEVQDNYILVTGTTRFPAKASFDCGESGLTFRLLSALCCLHEGEYEFDGSGSILDRSHGFIDDFGLKYGIEITSNNNSLPYFIRGGLDPNLDSIEVDGSISSQFISGLLIGIPLLSRRIVLRAINLRSFPYVKMTLNTMKHFGVRVDLGMDNVFSFSNDDPYQLTSYSVQKDWSAASYWLVAGAIGHQVSLKGLNISTDQADVRILSVLTMVGATFLINEDELSFHSAGSIAFSFDATDCPDLFPALATLALFCNGLSRIKGVHRLVNKESDRSQVLFSQFQKIGAEIYFDGDEMCIDGLKALRFAKVSSHGDHRIAMCLAIAALQIEGGLQIEGALAVTKSYPDFWKDLEKLRPRKMGQ